jgi:hypothetical protein
MQQQCLPPAAASRHCRPQRTLPITHAIKPNAVFIEFVLRAAPANEADAARPLGLRRTPLRSQTP